MSSLFAFLKPLSAVVGLHLCAYYYFIWVVSLIQIICKTWMHMRWNPYLNLISLLFCDLLVQTSFGFILAASPFSISFFFEQSLATHLEGERWKFVRSAGPQIEFQWPKKSAMLGGWKYFWSPARERVQGSHGNWNLPRHVFLSRPAPRNRFYGLFDKIRQRSISPRRSPRVAFLRFPLRLRPKIINTTPPLALTALRIFTARGRKFYLGALS